MQRLVTGPINNLHILRNTNVITYFINVCLIHDGLGDIYVEKIFMKVEFDIFTNSIITV